MMVQEFSKKRPSSHIHRHATNTSLSWRRRGNSMNYFSFLLILFIGCSTLCRSGVGAFVPPCNDSCIRRVTRTAKKMPTFSRLPPKTPSTTSRVANINSASLLSMIAKSGGTPITTPEQFESDVLSTDTSRPVLVFFSAPWCGPCRLSNPVVRDVMKQFVGRINVVEVCTDDLPEVAANAGVVSIPTIQIYYGGEALDNIVGCVARNVLASAVNKILEDLGQGDPVGEAEGGQKGEKTEGG